MNPLLQLFGHMYGSPVMSQGAQHLNRLGQPYGQGNWGPGSQWYANHHDGGLSGTMQGGPVMAGAHPLLFGQQQQSPYGFGNLNQMQMQHLMQLMSMWGNGGSVGGNAGAYRPMML